MAALELDSDEEMADDYKEKADKDIADEESSDMMGCKLASVDSSSTILIKNDLGKPEEFLSICLLSAGKRAMAMMAVLKVDSSDKMDRKLASLNFHNLLQYIAA